MEVLSSEHYDVPDDDSDGENNAKKEATKCGAIGAGSTRVPEDGGVAVGAGVTEEGIGAEVLIRPPSYGFNDKVWLRSMYVTRSMVESLL